MVSASLSKDPLKVVIGVHNGPRLDLDEDSHIVRLGSCDWEQILRDGIGGIYPKTEISVVSSDEKRLVMEIVFFGGPRNEGELHAAMREYLRSGPPIPIETLEIRSTK